MINKMINQAKLNAIKKYNRNKVTIKPVAFYIKDEELLELANSINFQHFVKTKLQELLKERESYGTCEN